MTADDFRRTITTAFSTAQVRAAADKAIGARGINFIDTRTRAGKFLGGDKQNSTYSSKPLPLFFFGRIAGISKNGAVTVKNTRGNITPTFSKNEVAWRTARNGKRTAFLIGGYRAYRAKTGRQTEPVNLTFTGRMLNALRYLITSGAGGLTVRFDVTDAENDKAYYTNLRRTWLSFSGEEIQKLSSGLQDEIAKGLK